VTYFRCDRSVEELTEAWNRTGPYRWEIGDSYDRGDYLRAMVGGNKVRVYHDPPLYEIDVLTPVGTSKEQELTERLALDDVFRNVLFPPVRGTEEMS
jgi:hypothetical protein